MRTTYPHTGIRETPPDLLERFGARLGVFHTLAWSTIEIRDLAARAGVDANLEMPIEMARAPGAGDRSRRHFRVQPEGKIKVLPLPFQGSCAMSET